jgi:heme-degrading monooxygenase HmoA
MNITTTVQNYASGDWRVRAGAEDEFIARWTEFLQWTRAEAPGFLMARLICDPEDPAHFVSFAEWENLAAIQRWRGLPDFGAKMGACRSLCEEFRGSNYTLVVQVR